MFVVIIFQGYEPINILELFLRSFLNPSIKSMLIPIEKAAIKTAPMTLWNSLEIKDEHEKRQTSEHSKSMDKVDSERVSG